MVLIVVVHFCIDIKYNVRIFSINNRKINVNFISCRYKVYICILFRYLQFLTISFSIFSVIMIIPGNLLNEKYGIRTTI